MINDKNFKENPRPSSKDEEDIKEYKDENLHEDDKQETSNQLAQNQTITKDHPLYQILQDIKRGVRSRSHVKYFTFISHIQPKSILRWCKQ